MFFIVPPPGGEDFCHVGAAQAQARSCKTIFTYMMTKKSTPTFGKYQTTLALRLTRAKLLSNKLPNHISEAFLIARSKYKNIL